MSAPFTDEQEAHFAIARVELLRARAEVKRLEASLETEAWERGERYPGPVQAVRHQIVCSLRGAEALVEFWSEHLPSEFGGDGRAVGFRDYSGELIVLRPALVAPNPSSAPPATGEGHEG